MHQDVFSPMFCGEGIPDWAVYTGCKQWPIHWVQLPIPIKTSMWFDICCFLKLPKVFLSHCPNPILWIQCLATQRLWSALTKTSHGVAAYHFLACLCRTVPSTFGPCTTSLKPPVQPFSTCTITPMVSFFPEVYFPISFTASRPIRSIQCCDATDMCSCGVLLVLRVWMFSNESEGACIPLCRTTGPAWKLLDKSGYRVQQQPVHPWVWAYQWTMGRWVCSFKHSHKEMCTF